MVIVIPLGFATKFYSGPARAWVNGSLSAVFYEIFWCLLVAAFLHHARPLAIAVGVFLATSFLEFTQLWHPPFLQALRASFIGVTLLGDTFVPSDFAYYALGCITGWGIVKRVRADAELRPDTSIGTTRS